MSINAYIDSLTRIDKSKNVENVNWSKVHQDKKSQPRPSYGKGIIPYQFESSKADQCQSTSYQRNQKYHRRENGHSNNKYCDSNENYGQHRFADISSSVREVGVGYNTFSNNAIERRFKENKSKHGSTDKSDSITTYTTVNSKSTEESFKTATENFSTLTLSSDEKNEVLVDDINEERYKKNALMTGLLQTQYDDSSNIDTSTENSSLRNASQDVGNNEDWEKEEDDEAMYKGRIIRFFQSAEDEDVFVHPLKEQVQKDPEWQKFQLKRKGVEVIQTPRQYYLGLDDESFNFQPKNMPQVAIATLDSQ